MTFSHLFTKHFRKMKISVTSNHVTFFTCVIDRHTVVNIRGMLHAATWKCPFLPSIASRGVPRDLKVRCQAYDRMTNHVMPAIMEKYTRMNTIEHDAV